MPQPTKEEKKKLCKNCKDDYYNHDGHSDTGECWMLKSSKVKMAWCIGWHTPMDKLDRFWQQQTLTCHKETGSVLFMFNGLPSHIQKEYDERERQRKKEKRKNAHQKLQV